MRYLYTIKKKEFILGFSKGIFLALALYRYDALCRKSIGLKLFVHICSKVYYGKNFFEDTLAPF